MLCTIGNGMGAKNVRWPLPARVAVRAQRLEDYVCPFERAGIAPYDAAHLLEVQRFGKGRAWRHGEEREKSADLLGRINDKFAIPLHDVGGILEIPQHGSGAHHLNGMRLEEERCNHAEIPATPSNGPEQIGVLVSAGHNEGSVRKDEIGGEQVVNREAELARKVPYASAERQAAHASRGDNARRNRQPERVHGMIDVAPCAAAAHTHPAGARVEVHEPDKREIDDKAIVPYTQAAGVVASAAD